MGKKKLTVKAEPKPGGVQQKGRRAFTVLEVLCCVAILAILATISVPVVSRNCARLKWQISFIGTFHNSRISRAVDERDNLDVQLDNGDYWAVLKWQ